jgi:hypothetical protein
MGAARIGRAGLRRRTPSASGQMATIDLPRVVARQNVLAGS